jgi:hypothetical protein
LDVEALPDHGPELDEQVHHDKAFRENRAAGNPSGDVGEIQHRHW